MNSSDTKKIIGYLQLTRGMSKGQALAHVKAFTSEGLKEILLEIDRVSSPSDFVTTDQLKASGSRYFSSPKPDPTPDHLVNKPVSTKKPKKVPYTLLLTPSDLESLKAISETDGETVSSHIRAAIRSYLTSKR